ncbi:metal ABC transporter substrate-binding protein [Defluviitalea phaphyphila]|uniref:metal ABC transporter substrate-binding protein n=1 Tax=Defluviitalea phaphyphila TaxID=1473580 RepID=UPI0007306ED8|nr:metal ABC transporter substrate-binding protein [Defluviitalea phaphyphila]
MKKIIIFASIISILTLNLFGCSSQEESSDEKNDTISVYTSIYPLYDFAQKIGQDKVEVNLIVPPGAEPHDWEPSAKLIGKIENSDILIYNGAGMEFWIEKIIGSINNSNLTIVNSSENVELLKLNKDNLDHEDTLEDEDEHNHGEYDPHIWLDPLNAIIQSENIKNALIKVDSQNKDFYETNFNELKNKLLALDEKYRSTLSKLPKKEIVVSHAAFGYMANRYGLKQIYISGLSPQAEPTPSQMAEIANIIKEHDIKYIFFETLSNPKLAEVIAEETGAKPLVLNPLGSLTQEELDNNKDYFSIMEENLDSLQQALGE